MGKKETTAAEKGAAKKLQKKEEDKKVKVVESKVEDEEDEENQEDDQAWWEMANLQIAQKGEKRWDTLEHNGVLFPPAYVPHKVPIYYDGVRFDMTPEEEEVATMFAQMKEHDFYRNEIFRKNFFADWRRILDKRGSHPIKILELCDFEPIWIWHQGQRAKFLARTKEEKKAAKAENDKLIAPYKHCLWDGKKEEVANYRVEPPGLFRGRGKHPKCGMLKQRVHPEDITINIGAGAKIPEPPAGHKWKEVRHDNTVTWLAMWQDNVTDNHKYVMLHASSSVKGMSDLIKFEKARKLKEHVDTIRQAYRADFKSPSIIARQRAVAMYFIDKLAIRAGNEKDDDEADTVGCCSLRCEHLKPVEGNKLFFSFLGKDSILYENTVEVDPEVYRLVESFRKGKGPKDEIFNEISTTVLNKHLSSFMPGLTAKVFRTYNASWCLQEFFKENPLPKNLTEIEKVAYFNAANTKVAILCNHQKTVSKTHDVAMQNFQAKIDFTQSMISRLEKVKAAKNYEKAVKEFWEEEDRLQREWLNQWGSAEEKVAYEELVANRGAPRQRKVAEKSDAKTEKVTKEAPKKRSREAEVDEALDSIVKKGAKKESPAAAAKKPEPKKPEPKKGSKAKKEESDDEDVPLGKITKGKK